MLIGTALMYLVAKYIFPFGFSTFTLAVQGHAKQSKAKLCFCVSCLCVGSTQSSKAFTVHVQPPLPSSTLLDKIGAPKIESNAAAEAGVTSSAPRLAVFWQPPILWRW